MKLAVPIRCRHCGRAVDSPDDPQFYSLHFTVVDPHTDQWSCGACLTPEEQRVIILQLIASAHTRGELAPVTPGDVAAALREAGLVRQEELLLHQFVNVSWRALVIALQRASAN